MVFAGRKSYGRFDSGSQRCSPFSHKLMMPFKALSVAGISEDRVRRLAYERASCCSLGVGDRVISFFTPDKQSRQSARRVDLNFDAVPLAVIDEVRRAVSDGILMSQFEGDLFEDVIHLGVGPWVE